MKCSSTSFRLAICAVYSCTGRHGFLQRLYNLRSKVHTQYTRDGGIRESDASGKMAARELQSDWLTIYPGFL